MTILGQYGWQAAAAAAWPLLCVVSDDASEAEMAANQELVCGKQKLVCGKEQLEF